jgi:hypothetical protein
LRQEKKVHVYDFPAVKTVDMDHYGAGNEVILGDLYRQFSVLPARSPVLAKTKETIAGLNENEIKTIVVGVQQWNGNPDYEQLRAALDMNTKEGAEKRWSRLKRKGFGKKSEAICSSSSMNIELWGLRQVASASPKTTSRLVICTRASTIQIPLQKLTRL